MAFGYQSRTTRTQVSNDQFGFRKGSLYEKRIAVVRLKSERRIDHE